MGVGDKIFVKGVYSVKKEEANQDSSGADADKDLPRVADGPYWGEKVGACSEIAGLMRISGVVLTAAQAENVRKACNYDESTFYLDMSSRVEGIYCHPYKNAEMNRFCYEKIRPSDFDESWLGVFWGKVWGMVPFWGQESKYSRMRESFDVYIQKKEPGALAKLWDGSWIGAGFALAAIVVNVVAKKLTGGKSIIDLALERIRKGGPKGPPAGGPPAGGAAPGGGGGKPVEEKQAAAPKSVQGGDDLGPRSTDRVKLTREIEYPSLLPAPPLLGPKLEEGRGLVFPKLPALQPADVAKVGVVAFMGAALAKLLQAFQKLKSATVPILLITPAPVIQEQLERRERRPDA